MENSNSIKENFRKEKYEENSDNEEIKKEKEELDKNIFKKLDNICELKHQLDLSKIKINEKAINKVLKEKPFMVPIMYKKSKKQQKEEKKPKEKKEDDGFNCCQYYMFPSGINKTCLKNMKTG